MLLDLYEGMFLVGAHFFLAIPRRPKVESGPTTWIRNGCMAVPLGLLPILECLV